MRAIQIDRYGGPEVLRFHEVEQAREELEKRRAIGKPILEILEPSE